VSADEAAAFEPSDDPRDQAAPGGGPWDRRDLTALFTQLTPGGTGVPALPAFNADDLLRKPPAP